MPSGADLARLWFEHSPFNRELGLVLDRLEDDLAVGSLPAAESNAAYADIVHGGAIGTLCDVTAAMASWSAAEVEGTPRGATISLSIDFLRAGRGPLTCRGEISKRGSAICFCDLAVTDAEETLVAKALATYKLG